MALSPTEFDLALDRIHQHASEARANGDQRALRVALREHTDLLRRQYGLARDMSAPDIETVPSPDVSPFG
jgi:hypothetical protein